LRILQVCPTYYNAMGGVAQHTRNLSERLGRKHDVTVAALDPTGSLPKEERISRILVKRFPVFAPSKMYFYSSSLLKFLLKNCGNYDIVHAHNYHSFPFLAAVIAKKPKLNLILTPHYFGLGSSMKASVAHIPYSLVGLWMFQSASRIVCVSRAERRILVKRYLIDSSKTCYIPNGVNFEEISQSKPSLENSDVFRIIYVGRLSKEKNLETLIEACSEVQRKIKNMQLMIVGDGPERVVLKELALKNRLENILWMGKIQHQDIGGYYKSASVFVLPSVREVFGITILEAMAAGIPVVVSDGINLAYEIAKEDAGLVFKKSHKKALAKKILDVYFDSALRKRLVMNGLKYAEQFNWDTIAESHIALYKSVLRENDN
jgi:glycosyltransferase involved in cell wall biosynthesis